MRQADTGVNRNNVVMVTCEKTLKQHQAFKQEVAAMPSVERTATANNGFYGGGPVGPVKTKTPGREIRLGYMIVDTGFIPLMGFQWKEKPSSMATVMDGRHPVLNEVAVAQIGFSGRATGQNLQGNDLVGGTPRALSTQLSIDFLRPVGLSLLLAIPVSAWVMHGWLNKYAYRVPLTECQYDIKFTVNYVPKRN